MWGAIASLILGIFKWLFGGRQQAAGISEGVATQRASDATAAAMSEGAVAKSEAQDADLTRADIDRRLRDGTF